MLLLDPAPHVLASLPAPAARRWRPAAARRSPNAPPSGPGTTAPTADNPPPTARGPPATPRPRPSAGPCTRDSSRATCMKREPAARRRSCGNRSARSRARSPCSPRSPRAPPSRTPAAAGGEGGCSAQRRARGVCRAEYSQGFALRAEPPGHRAGAVDLRRPSRCRADQQRCRACPAPWRAEPKDQLRYPQSTISSSIWSTAIRPVAPFPRFSHHSGLVGVNSYFFLRRQCLAAAPQTGRADQVARPLAIWCSTFGGRSNFDDLLTGGERPSGCTGGRDARVRGRSAMCRGKPTSATRRLCHDLVGARTEVPPSISFTTSSQVMSA